MLKLLFLLFKIPYGAFGRLNFIKRVFIKTPSRLLKKKKMQTLKCSNFCFSSFEYSLLSLPFDFLNTDAYDTKIEKEEKINLAIQR